MDIKLNIKKIIGLSVPFMMVSILSGCANMPVEIPGLPKAGTETSDSGNGNRICEQGSSRASIAVSKFTNKSGGGWGYNRSIGWGMADQLTTPLFNTGCFKVVDRQNLQGVIDEQTIQQSGSVDPRTAVRAGRIAGADLIITAAVTEFMENAKGSKAVGSGSLGDVVGIVMGGSESAHMAIDLRVTDVQTSEVIAAQTIEGSAKDINWGAILGGTVGNEQFRGVLSGWEKTPRGKAMRAVIKHSVKAIIDTVPKGYFRHSAAGGRFGNASKRTVSTYNSVGAKAQKALKELGFYNGPIDGDIGPKSIAAIKSFQSAYNLSVTGKLDTQTIKKLNSISQ